MASPLPPAYIFWNFGQSEKTLLPYVQDVKISTSLQQENKVIFFVMPQHWAHTEHRNSNTWTDLCHCGKLQGSRSRSCSCHVCRCSVKDSRDIEQLLGFVSAFQEQFCLGENRKGLLLPYSLDLQGVNWMFLPTERHRVTTPAMLCNGAVPSQQCPKAQGLTRVTGRAQLAAQA